MCRHTPLSLLLVLVAPVFIVDTHQHLLVQALPLSACYWYVVTQSTGRAATLLAGQATELAGHHRVHAGIEFGKLITADSVANVTGQEKAEDEGAASDNEAAWEDCNGLDLNSTAEPCGRGCCMQRKTKM